MDVFETLEPLLVAAIPPAIAAMKRTKPICCVRLYYYDPHAPCAYLTLKTISADCRAKVVSDKGRSAPFHLWSAGEECGDGMVELPSDPPANKAEKQLAKWFAKVYGQLEEDEDEAMPPLRAMLQRVAAQLNSMDWKSVCAVTDDFVVVPADGSQFFGGEDYEELVASVPAERLDLLRSRGLLGLGEMWDQLP